MFLTKKAQESQWIDLYLNFKGDSALFLVVVSV